MQYILFWLCHTRTLLCGLTSYSIFRHVLSCVYYIGLQINDGLNAPSSMHFNKATHTQNAIVDRQNTNQISNINDDTKSISMRSKY